MTDEVFLWRRLDMPGKESARLTSKDAQWHLEGVAVFEHGTRSCRLAYKVICDAGWKTQSGRVIGRVGESVVDVEVTVDDAGRWRFNGEARPQLAGCVDLDFNFSPSTNMLPIRRLGLAVGQEARVRAAWLRDRKSVV